MLKIFLAFFLLLTGFLRLNAIESVREKNLEIQNIVSTQDVDLLEGFSTINVLVSNPAPLNLSKKIQEEVNRELKKIGNVTSKQFSIENLINEKELLKCPFLIYEIKSVKDLQGEILPILQVSLKFETSLEVTKNKQYGQAFVWGKGCFIKTDGNISPIEAAVPRTLSFLLESFKKDYLKANEKSHQKLNFILIE